MSSPSRGFYAVLCAFAAVIISLKVRPALERSCQVGGIWRTVNSSLVYRDDDLVYIPDTIQCEDLHFHQPSGLIFTACQDNHHSRLSWFPPLSNFDDPIQAMDTQGSIHVINPETFTSTRLEMENFDGPFITHGIDITADPEDSESIYIFAVNHLPHLQYLNGFFTGKPTEKMQKAQSVIELFHYTFGSASIRHVRTIQHHLIATPNDIFARSPKSFFITNDHHYREGFMRVVEDMYPNRHWTNVIHIAVTDMFPASGAPHHGVEASVALDHTYNNNGLGHGRMPDEILVSECLGGRLLIGQISINNQIRIVDSIESPAAIDNPSYFSDPYGDKSGFVLPSVSKALTMTLEMKSPQHKIPSIVVLASPQVNATTNMLLSPISASAKETDRWATRTLFEDDGSRLSTASGAVLVPISPAKSVGDKRQAWLFTSGFLSHSMVAVRVDL
ncbi:Serum paraoxonase/arylesterase 2 [Ceratocystis lukuohia]|uniref:Serum paraoxonase/arylesterase 2 n=1 Tax=Ceratocystis lukuohia TaxID=2019550 RepID=A0ABR4MP12_9PEZI